MTKSDGVAAKTLEIKAGEIDRVRLILFFAYLLAVVAVGLVVYTRGELAEWTE